MNVLLACYNSRARGGIQRWCDDLAAGLRQVGVTVDRVEIDDPASCVDTVREALRRTRPSVFHLTQMGLLPLATEARKLGFPTVLTLHGNDLLRPWLSVPMLRSPERIDEALGAVARVTTVSGRVAQLIERAGSIEVVPNAIDTRRFRPGSRAEARARLGVPAGRPLVLTVARLVPRKGHLQVLDALAELPNVHYAVVGDGRFASAVHAGVESRGLADRVHLLGEVSDSELLDWYHAADLFVLTTMERWDERGLDIEGFGLVYLEAQACGLPVVAARAGGAPEAVGEPGLLVPAEDGRALTAAIQRLLADPDERRARGEAGAKRVARHFDQRAQVRSFVGIYGGVDVESATDVRIQLPSRLDDAAT